MKKLAFLAVVGLAVMAAPTFAHENEYGDDQRSHYVRTYHRDDISREINHVNRMLEHVRWQLRRYNASWRTRAEVRHISGEIAHVNWEYNHGDYRSWHIRRELEHIYAELHNVELQLRVRSSDYYRWD